MPDKVDIRLFGEPRILVDGEALSLTAEQQMMVAVLGAAGPDGISKGLLYEEVFGGRVTKSGEQAALMRVRRLAVKVKDASGMQVIRTAGRCGFDPDLCSVDAWDFLSLTRDGTSRALLAAARSWADPYAGLTDLSPVVRMSATELGNAYRASLGVLGPNLSSVTDHDLIVRLVQLAELAEVDETLAASAAAALYNAGQQTEALRIISKVRANLREVHGLNAGGALAEVERSILRNDQDSLGGSPADPLVRQASRPQASEAIFVGRSDVMRSLRERIEALPRPDAEVETDIDPVDSVVLIEGDGGVGKTALLAQLFDEFSNGDVSLRFGTAGVAGSAQPSCYSIFTQAFPQLSGIEGSDDVGDEVATAAFFRHVQQLVFQTCKGRPQVVVLDNMHLADYQSVLLFRFLVRSARPSGLLLIATTRPPAGGTTWADELVALSEERGVAHHKLGAFVREDLEELVAAYHPRASTEAAARFVEYLVRVGANPLVSTAITRAADADLDMSIVPESGDSNRAYEEHLRRVIRESSVETVLAVASLIGEAFSPGQVAEVLSVSRAFVDSRLAQAAAARVCTRIDEDLWCFDHLITVAHFSERCGLLRPLILAKLARMGSEDPAQMLRYAIGAYSELTPAERVAMFTSIARTATDHGLISEAFSAWQALLAEDDTPDELRTEASVGAAAMLARLGRHELAANLGAPGVVDGAPSLGSPAAGQPSFLGVSAAEHIGGGSERLELLQLMTPAEREAAEPAEFARWRRRLQRLAGSPPTVEQVAAERFDVSRGSILQAGQDRQYEEFLCEKWNFEVQKRDCKPMYANVLRLLDKATESSWRTQLLLNAVLAALNEQRPAEEFLDLYQRATVEILAYAPPRTQWSLDIVSATINQVGMAETGTGPDDARSSGVRWGISDAVDTWFAQTFVGLWLAGQVGMVQTLMEAPSFGVGLNGAWRAVWSLSAATNGDWETAGVQAKCAAAAVEARPDDAWTSTSAALLAETAVLLNDSQLAKLVEGILSPRSGWAVVLGNGSAYLGPADRYRGLAATLTGAHDPDELFSQAVSQARTTGAKVWEQRALQNLTNFDRV
ncbi:MAG: AAA family ATPase [Actinobacteria bacterium]|nr:AAA family ATPase [Actinomycetota bacterium]